MSSPILLVEHDPNSPPGTLTEWLENAGATVQHCRPHAGEELPADLGGHSALVMLGGGRSAYSDKRFEWRSATIDLLQQAAASNTPTYAMCLGAQLVAHAFGGVVERGDLGMEIGPMQAGRKDVSYSDELFDTLPMAPDVIEFHGDAITQLPPGAAWLMGGPLYEHQAFRVGERMWATQFHIETTPEIFNAWMRDNEEGLRRRGFDTDLLIERYAVVHPDLAETWEPFVRKFVEIAHRVDQA
ncbi:MAG: type 1 glutamine amidotransferase [Cumulibacter sp.]